MKSLGERINENFNTFESKIGSGLRMDLGDVVWDDEFFSDNSTNKVIWTAPNNQIGSTLKELGIAFKVGDKFQLKVSASNSGEKYNVIVKRIDSDGYYFLEKI